MNISLPETYLLASYEELRISFFTKVMENLYKDKQSSFGTVLEEYKDDLYHSLRKHTEIKTLQRLNKIKIKDQIYQEFNKKYLKPNMALRMEIIKCEKSLVEKFYKNICEVKTIDDVSFISYKDFVNVYSNAIGDLIEKYKTI